MAYVKKSYAFKGEKMVTFAGHIKVETAKKRGFDSVTLIIHDTSGKGRGEERRFYAPEFTDMRQFS